ncbi:MAG TPA: histidine kinase, partial [Terriglobales bacterium]|nr:histidine kinase [Terriglobales bacterium]
LDSELCFRRVNGTWAEMTGAPAEAHLGRSVREVVPGFADQIEPCMRRVLHTGQRMLNLEVCGATAGGEDSVSHWVANYFPICSLNGDVSGIGCVFLNNTTCRRAEASLRRLSGRLMELQDQERRRIARELHDSIGQCLTAIKINVETLDRSLPKESLDARTAKALAEAVNLADQCSADTRTISYLLHPPLLDERGLTSAIRWYADGFAQRSGLRLTLDLPKEGARLPQPVETTLFRIVQESLTNIHRHSGSAMAEIRLLIDAESVVLEVRDQGCGMPIAGLRRCQSTGHTVGVGIAGMRERVHQFGGRLQISSSPHGMLVRATIPLGGAA